ncbi:unnamed protein product, partial [Trichobilharzia szidati]
IATSNSPPTYPEGLSAGLISVLDACFARNPIDRPTANQLLTFKIFADLISQQVVTSSIDEEKTQQPQPPPPPPPPQPSAQPQPVQKQKEPVPLQSLHSSSSSLKAIITLNTSKNRDKTLKSQMNTTKSNTKSSSTSSSFSYQRFLKTFQSNKNSPSLNHKKFIRLHEVLQESKEEYQRKQPQEDMIMIVGKCERHQQMPITSPSDENSKCIRQLSDHHHQQHQPQHQQQQQQESNQHVDDTVLLTRRQKFRRPTLPGLSFHRKYRSRTPVAISFN